MERKERLFFFKYVSLLCSRWAPSVCVLTSSFSSIFLWKYSDTHNARTPPGDNFSHKARRLLDADATPCPVSNSTWELASHPPTVSCFDSFGVELSLTNPNDQKNDFAMLPEKFNSIWKTSWKAHRVDSTTLEDCCCSRDNWHEVTLVWLE